MISKQQLSSELEEINRRRRANGFEPLPLGDSDRPIQGSGASGLALSGGGIRSAAVCLGAVQALQANGKLEYLDYLSTVSGGGYLGCCLAANMSERGFPFLNEKNDLNDLQDSAAVKYIRDHTNYLMPSGFGDFLASLGIILRGLATSAILVLGPLLILAGLTAYAFSLGLTTGKLTFPLTLGFGALFLLYLIVLAVHRSMLEAEGRSAYEFRGSATRWTLAAICICILATLFAIEIQPVAVLAIRTPIGEQGWFSKVIAAVMAISKYLAPFAGAVAAFGSWFVEVARASERNPTTSAMLKSALSRAAIWMAAIVIPLLLWRLYLELASAAIPEGTGYPFALGILRQWGEYIAPGYLVIGAVLFCSSWFFEPNANSLHRLYRDRLGDAFLFLAPSGNEEDVNPLDGMKLSGLDVTRSPYLLVNTALNIQRSEYANKRGRGADFFMFSRHWVGSHATGYVPTETIEKCIPTLDMATVMAVSGAAASSNMGASALKPLAFTLALLNVRLGYWMRNPNTFKEKIDFGGRAVASSLRPYLRSTFYLWSEMFSTLDETNDAVYLTDGGHIENLGIYELLRRRCRLIVAIDAEADPDLRFPSLIALQRYARLDFGIRIDLPWEKIRERHVKCCAEIVESAESGLVLTGTSGCHAAIGRIVYPDGPVGTIVYVKSSLTGDEDDIVLDYKRRYPGFPHETTMDQFFGEEQFEAYRALGFHAVHRLLRGEDTAACPAEFQGESKEARAAKMNEIFEPNSRSEGKDG